MPRKMRTVVTTGVAAIVVGAWLQNCFWLRPLASRPVASKAEASVSVDDVKLIEPRTEGGPYRIEATVAHSGHSGPVDLAYRLRNSKTGETVERVGRVELRPGLVVVAVLEIPAPRAYYAAEVEVRSPRR